MKEVKILYVEDELTLATIVRDTLEANGYKVLHVSDGAEVIDAVARYEPDICLLDVMLPNRDGFDIGTEMATRWPDLPVIFLTAKSQTEDVMRGFKSGGNDYVRKPFSMEELMIRIDNLLSMKSALSKTWQKAEMQIGRYLFESKSQILKIDDDAIQLTFREAELVQLFGQHINDVIQKKDILLKIWGDDSYYNSRNLDVYINKLRTYFESDPGIEILTLRGVGYRFNVVD